jgi:hypothetical protein
MRDVHLTPSERKALERLLARRSAHAGHVRRARVILLSAEGGPGLEIAERVGITEQHIVGLYLCPPDNAIVLSVDEKTSIQALERTQLPLPMRQGRAARHTHDYKRHGVLDLYAAR